MYTQIQHKSYLVAGRPAMREGQSMSILYMWSTGSGLLLVLISIEVKYVFWGGTIKKCGFYCFNPISLRGVSRKHTSYIIDSHVKMSEVNGFFFLDFANWAFPNTSKKSLLKNLSKIFEKIRSEAN